MAIRHAEPRAEIRMTFRCLARPHLSVVCWVHRKTYDLMRESGGLTPSGGGRRPIRAERSDSSHKRDHHTAVDAAVSHIVEDRVDVLECVGRVMSDHFALAGELQRLCQVGP